MDQTTTQDELKRMKLVATSLLVAFTLLYIVASIFEESYIWVGFVSATAEAAMVGALADWFAVTALFRYPLGLKIPHTAIIPRRKDAIAEQFGSFVQRNFLSEEVISNKLRSIQISHRVAEWIRQPENSALIADQADVVPVFGMRLQIEFGTRDDPVVEAHIDALHRDRIRPNLRSC